MLYPRTVLRTSLWAELMSLAKLMREEIDYICKNDFTWVPLVQSFQIYIANIQNLGIAHSGTRHGKSPRHRERGVYSSNGQKSAR
jgi:hypothetical protein